MAVAGGGAAGLAVGAGAAVGAVAPGDGECEGAFGADGVAVAATVRVPGRWATGEAEVAVAGPASLGSVTSGMEVVRSGSARSVPPCSSPMTCPVTATAPAASADAATAAATTTMPRRRLRCRPRAAAAAEAAAPTGSGSSAASCASWRIAGNSPRSTVAGPSGSSVSSGRTVVPPGSPDGSPT